MINLPVQRGLKKVSQISAATPPPAGCSVKIRSAEESFEVAITVW
jgi:hypothetical protein